MHDQLLVVATEKVRGETERRIRAVDRAGRFARWKGETGNGELTGVVLANVTFHRRCRRGRGE